MRLPSGTIDQYCYFYAVDSTDFTTPETGLTGFTVYRSRDGGALTAYTTPTTAELSAGNAPGLYSLLLDEDMTIASGNDSEEMALHITKTGMAPVVRTIELYRPIVTSGQTLTVSAGLISNTTAITSVSGAVGSVTGAVGSVAAGGITAASIATGAIDADALATDAVTEIWAGSTAPTASAIADQVWDEVIAGHLTAGTTGNALNASGSAGDPWATALPGAYGAGTAGKIIGDNINAPLSTIDTVVDAILVDTGTDIPAQITALNDLTGTEIANAVWDEVLTGHSTLASASVYLKNAHQHAQNVETTIGTAGNGLTALPWNATWDAEVQSEVADALNVYDPPTKAELDSGLAALPTATQNADALLNRDMSAVSDTTARSPLNALRLLRNKYSIAAGTLTVTKENDSTQAWTATITSDAAADPIIGSDPA